MDSNLEIRKADKSDLGEILKIQRSAYLAEAAIYEDYSIAPLHESVSEIETDSASSLILVALVHGKVVGSIRGKLDGAKVYISRLSVKGEYQGRGIGGRLLQAIEDEFEGCIRFELFTGHKSEKNKRLYATRGYAWSRDQAVSERLALYWMAKEKVGIGF